MDFAVFVGYYVRFCDEWKSRMRKDKVKYQEER